MGDGAKRRMDRAFGKQIVEGQIGVLTVANVAGDDGHAVGGRGRLVKACVHHQVQSHPADCIRTVHGCAMSRLGQWKRCWQEARCQGSRFTQSTLMAQADVASFSTCMSTSRRLLPADSASQPYQWLS